MLRSRGMLIGGVLAGVFASNALAQSDQEINASVKFNYAPPGARSMAMGGAFLGLADDATAAYANPAGLTALTRPELSFEGRMSNFKSVFTDRGSEPPRTPSGQGIDNIAGLEDGNLEDSVGSPAFASFVYPKGRIAIALYRHELVNYVARVESFGPYSVRNTRFFPAIGELELGLTTYGFAFAFKASDQLSIGAGASLVQLDLSSLTDRHAIGNPSATAVGGFYGPPDTAASNVINTQTQAGDGDAWAFNVGILFKPNDKVQVGAVYRQGADFEGDVALANRPGPQTSFTPIEATSGFKVPDAFGGGLVVRPNDRLTLAADVMQVLNSQRLDYFETVFGSDIFVEDYAVDDGTEVHVGLEYVFAGMSRPVALRAGAWLEPDSRIRYIGDPNQSGSDSVQFRAGEDEWHVAFGLGWVLSPKFQIDAAGDIADRTKVGTVSAVVRF
ncbi:MAG: outer membrane protein transport protein [Vicinamibacteria bacterium]|nr:outer membrane protein transport protein [Vicinamibacteria bacterium]